MISIFANNATLKETPTGTYVKRVSSRIRGEEICNYLGSDIACYNPKERSEINIFLKPRALSGLNNGDYVDILDEVNLVPRLKQRPGIKVITMSQAQHEYLSKELENELFLIPHHHINFIRYRRWVNPKLKGGMIGHSQSALDLAKKIRVELDKVNIGFDAIVNYQTREDMLEFFKSIDFLVVWNIDKYKDYPHSHPTKLINASSFGIPVFSQPILAYKEFEGKYIHISDINSLVEELKLFRQYPERYNKWSDIAFNGAEPYHISHIAEKYKQLK